MTESYQSVLGKLSKAVETNAKYKIDDTINKNLLAEDARKYDSGLLNILQKDIDLKNHFFVDTDGGLIFKKDVFLQFISNKEFLPDSYTKYANKVGLGSDDGSLLSGSKEVVLNWPYKDAILEGGQDKEDQKRSEVFFNEVLAPDQITRLLDNKVFTNWKRYDKDGEHELDELKDDDNLIIKGNNLVVLHSLKKRYAGKVKLIYIDPPYNTGNDSFGYNDSFNHSTWLTFMRNRLEIARDLLTDDGAFFVQCDDNEQAYLKVLMDEVFKGNFLTTICVQMSYVSGEKMAHIDKKPPKIKEYLHIYTKTKGIKITPQYTEAALDDEYNKYIEKNDSDNVADWDVINLKDKFKELKLTDETEREDFMMSHADLIFNRVRNKSEVYKKTAGNKKLVPITTATGLSKYAWNGREVVFLSSRVALDHMGDKTYQQAVGDIWSDIPIVSLYLEGGVSLNGGKKPEFLIKRIIDMVTSPGDLVLDYHVGSGTTAAVAHKTGRKYIGIEQLYYGDNDPTKRLRNVIDGDASGISKSVGWQGGGSFVYTNIMNNANNFRERVEQAKNDKDYIDLLDEAASSSFLSYRVDPTKLNDAEFHRLSSADKRRLLLELIDNNTLYVNYEDINDPSFKVSDLDKKFNKELYK